MNDQICCPGCGANIIWNRQTFATSQQADGKFVRYLSVLVYGGWLQVVHKCPVYVDVLPVAPPKLYDQDAEP